MFSVIESLRLEDRAATLISKRGKAAEYSERNGCGRGLLGEIRVGLWGVECVGTGSADGVGTNRCTAWWWGGERGEWVGDCVVNINCSEGVVKVA